MLEDIPAPDAPVLVTVAEAARRLAIGRSHLYRFIESGQLRSLRIGRCRRVRLADIDEFLDALSRRSVDPARRY